MGIQDEVLGGQRPAQASTRVGKKEQFVGNPCLLLTAEPPRAQLTSSKALQKGSIHDWGFSSEKTPENVKGRPQRHGGEGE